MEVLVEHLHKVVNCFQVIEIVVRDVYANAEVQTGVSSIHDFEVAKLKLKKVNIYTQVSFISNNRGASIQFEKVQYSSEEKMIFIKKTV